MPTNNVAQENSSTKYTALPTTIIFTRAPRLGAVKRRLALTIGQRAALRFHTASLSRLARTIGADRRFRAVLAVTPDRARFRLHARMHRIPQGPGDVGARMDRAFRRFPKATAVLIGTDIPAIAPADLVAAFRALGRAQAVFGPAEDGGYWLVGLAPGRRPARPFAGVRWSIPHALSDTLRNFKDRRVEFLRTLRDVDDGADLPPARPIRPRA
jgi:rSAM/selenodomain-associated transferase 1